MEILKNINPKKLFDPAYIFEKTPDSGSNYRYLAILFGILIILSFLAWFFYGKKKKTEKIWGKMQGKVFNLFFYIGIIGLILIFSRFEEIPYLGSRLFLLLLALIFCVWAIEILYYRLIIMNKKFAEIKKKNEFDKYLPRRQSGLPHKK